MDDIQAFPHFEKTFVHDQEVTVRQTGMTLRDYFAGQVIMGALGGNTGSEPPEPKIVALWSYKIADAMLKEREKH